MSMIGNFLQVSQAELEEYLNDSSKLEDRIYDEESDEEDEKLLDIDKTWDGIIFLLTGNSVDTADDPLVRILFSGQLIDEEQDLGYGPGHYLTPEQVKELNSEIKGLTKDDLYKRFDPAEMSRQEVYPDIWDEGDEAFDYVYDGFVSVQELFANAAKNNDAIITFLN